METHLAGEEHNLVLMLRLDTVYGSTVGMTEHDQDITYDLSDPAGDLLYRSDLAIFPSQLELSLGFDVDDIDIKGHLNDVVTRARLFSGFFADAVVYLFMVNWTDLTDGHIPLFVGFVTDIRLNDDEWVFTLSSEMAKYKLTRGRVVTPYDDRRDPPDDTPVAATVTAVSGTRGLTVSFSGAYADDYFNRGTLEFLTGPLAGGRRIEVASWTSAGVIETWTRLPIAIGIGDTLNLRRAYPRTIEEFITRFGDATDFRGFPYVPGKDRYLAATIPGA